MAHSINFLHLNGIIHRDIKPDNFLVISLSSAAPVSVKITDFGTARSTTSAEEAFSHTAGVGTPAFMAPEILDQKSYSQNVDVYGYALCLWMLATRDKPYKDFKRQWDIPRFVTKGKRLPLPLSIGKKFCRAIKYCWLHDTQERWSAEKAVQYFTKLEKSARRERGTGSRLMGPAYSGSSRDNTGASMKQKQKEADVKKVKSGRRKKSRSRRSTVVESPTD
eukprot:TRINITY_DN14702_c0_g1_i1.p1 TRINITY_DN14702_c0_g1~~TRINITY_DN14702_c0_g1_i1.p1  ORF type:complete len:221 (-),score=27.71 TRINITY_DN14702_c0_g1_i1:244-906(-)